MCLLFVLALVIATATECAQAFQNEPDGFGPVRFGMSAEAVQKALPAVKHKGTEEFLALYELENQSVLGLKPCSIDLRFVDDKLYEVGARCNQQDKVVPTLRKKFGEPTQEKGAAIVWLSDRRAVSLNTQAKVFTFTDQSLGRLAQQKLLQYVLTHQVQAQPTASMPAPRSTP